MKWARDFAAIAVAGAASVCHGQGTLIFDQQSSASETYSSANVVLQNVHLGQSFTPSLSRVDFVRLMVGDRIEGNGLGANLTVVLREGAVAGPILASSAPVLLDDGFKGVAHFAFSSSVTLTPGGTYVFEPTITADSDWWGINGWVYNYDGGVVFENGVPNLGSDLWFREGVVPEPSTFWLALLGLGLLAAGKWGRRTAGPSG